MLRSNECPEDECCLATNVQARGSLTVRITIVRALCVFMRKPLSFAGPNSPATRVMSPQGAPPWLGHKHVGSR